MPLQILFDAQAKTMLGSLKSTITTTEPTKTPSLLQKSLQKFHKKSKNDQKVHKVKNFEI